MYEPIIGLCVALALGVYLVYTLLHPEKFCRRFGFNEVTS